VDRARAGAGLCRQSRELALTVHLARITFPYLILTLVAVQLSAMLNAIEKFWAAAAWSNFLNLAMIATLLASRGFPTPPKPRRGVCCWGAWRSLHLFMLWAAAREGLSLRMSWPRWTPEIKEFFRGAGRRHGRARRAS
jgi:putative peptidoglycan lipid II flippase